jgi:threonine dehydratase
MTTVTLDSIRAARERIRDSIYHSPCPHSVSLSRLCGCEIYCKLDHLQMTGSFKERGARNRLLQLSDSQRKAGVVAASAGNHALGLAYHGQLLGIPVTVVMPNSAPLVKVANCRALGAQIILHGEAYADARELAQQLANEQGLAFIHGFNDLDIIAGQGTLALEILEDVPDLDAVIVPIGGGGLIAGMGVAIKGTRPAVRLIGAEPTHAPTLHESLSCGHLTRVEPRPTLADGLAIAEAGRNCYEIARTVLDEIVLVDEVQIATAILRLLELEKMVVEGSGATSLAAAMTRNLGLEGKKVVLCITGGNIDITMVSRIIERGLAAEGRLCRITAYLTDRPGSLVRLLKVLAEAGANVMSVDHDRNFGPADVAKVAVACTVETRDRDHIHEIHSALQSAGIEFTAV